MKLKLLFAATVAFAALPSAAQAQDVAPFTGPRIQAQAGWERVGIDIQDPRNFGGRGNFGLREQDNELTFGGEAGFDYQMGSIVIGAYVGVEFSDASEGFDDDADGDPRILLEADRNMYAGARVGFAPGGGNVLLYGKGGLSRGQLDATVTGTPTITYPVNEDDFDGWHFGGGVEMSMGMVYLRADYTHTSYDDLPINATNEVHFNRNTLTGAIGIRF